MGAWPAIHLLAQVAVLLLTFRALGSRATLSFRQLLLCGAFGASVGTVVLTIVQYQVFDHIDPPSAFWAWAPAQDLVVVGFVALLAASSRRRWRMSVVDFALAGAAVAAGTATVQLLMQTIVHDGPAAWYRPSFFFAIAGALHVPALDFSFVGPYVYGVVIGLAFGIGARLRPATNLWIVTGVVGGLIAIADHAESLSRLGDAYVTLGSPDTATSIGVTPPGFSDVVRTLMLHGRLLFFVAFGGLLLANVAEGLVVGRRLPDTRALMLPDEPTRPVSVIEWFTGWSALRRGVSAMRSTFAYFRARRSLLLCVTLHAPADEASDLAARALVARSDVEGPDAARARGGNIMDWLRGAWPVVVALAAVVVGLGLASGPIGDLEQRRWTQQAWVGGALLLIAVVVAVIQVVQLLRWRPPKPSSSVDDLDVVLRRWLAVGGVACVLFGIYAWSQIKVTTLTFTDLSPIVPYDSIGRFGQTFLVSWTDWGGNPLVVIAIVALLAFAWQTPRSHASRPPLPPPHVDARAAVGEHQEVAG